MTRVLKGGKLVELVIDSLNSMLELWSPRTLELLVLPKSTAPSPHR